MTGMGTRLKMLMACVRTTPIMDLVRVLTLKVRGENGMDSAAVNVTRIPMTMICLGMYVKEWNHEHPQGRPHKDQHSKIRWLVAYPVH